MGAFDTTAVLNSALPILAKNIRDAVEDDSVLFKYLKPVTKGDEGYNFDQGGYEYRWNINAESMLQVHAVNERGAVFTPVPNTNIQQAFIGPATLALTMAVDQIEAKRATGPYASYKNEMAWIEALFKPVKSLFAKELEQYTFMGSFLDRKVAAAATSFNGLTCLDPEFTAGTALGNANGVMDIAATTAQSKTVFGLAKDDGYRWMTQYNAIPSFGGGVGPAVHRQFISDCQRYARSGGTNIHAFQDKASFFTMADYVESRVVNIALKQTLADSEVIKGGSMASFTYRGVEYHLCYNIDCSTYSDSNAKNGVTFYIDCDEVCGYMPSAEEMVKGLSWVDAMKTGQPQASWVAACLVTLQWWMEWTASSGLIVGGGV